MSSLYAKYKKYCMKQYLKIGNSVEQAEDFVHDDFVTMLSSEGNLENKTALLTLTASRNAKTRTKRLREKFKNFAEISEDYTEFYRNLTESRPDKVLENKQNVERLHAGISELPDKQKEELRKLLNGERIKYSPKYGMKLLKKYFDVEQV